MNIWQQFSESLFPTLYLYIIVILLFSPTLRLQFKINISINDELNWFTFSLKQKQNAILEFDDTGPGDWNEYTFVNHQIFYLTFQKQRLVWNYSLSSVRCMRCLEGLLSHCHSNIILLGTRMNGGRVLITNYVVYSKLNWCRDFSGHSCQKELWCIIS